jgi:hypothetical protein
MLGGVQSPTSILMANFCRREAAPADACLLSHYLLLSWQKSSTDVLAQSPPVACRTVIVNDVTSAVTMCAIFLYVTEQCLGGLYVT